MTSFFEEQDERSRVKSEIVVKYFGAWARIMTRRADRVRYVDLFAGPGRYEDGQPSTPLLILQQVLTNQLLRERVELVFNDENADFVDRLKAEFETVVPVDVLAHPPQFHSFRAETQYGRFFGSNSPPSVTFLDPWGYAGLSRDLIRAVIQGWGSEAIFFFNYSRITAAVENPIVEPHMQALFDDVRLLRLRGEVERQTPSERERLILRMLGESLSELGGAYLIPFRFVRPGGKRHYICFVTKSPLGYRIMKEVMASAGMHDPDGVPLFEYYPAHQGRQLAFGDRPLRNLPQMLRETFAGNTIRVADLIDKHHIGTPFIPRNYKRVLLDMEASGEITCSKHNRNSMGDGVLVTFPR